MNVYQPMDIDELRRAIETHGPLYREPDAYGFEATDVDGEHAIVSWRNTFGEAPHGDMIAGLRKSLSRNGYEAKIGKPAKTTLIVRKVYPFVHHGSDRTMGPFEPTTTSRSERMGPFQSQVEAIVASKISTTIRNKVNDYLAEIGRQPLDKIPLNDIDKMLRQYGYLLVNEDGTEWSGFLTGREGRANIDIGVFSSPKDGMYPMVGNAMLVLTWHKFATGRWEVVAYIS